MIFVLCVFVHTASTAPSISVEPASIKVLEGERFTVSIIVDPAGSEVFGSEYKLYFDNTLLNVVNQGQGTFLRLDGTSTMNILNKINNSAGRTEYGEVRTGVTDGVTTSGILATITFNATKSGVCDLNLEDVILSELIDPDVQEIPGVVVNDGTCDIGVVGQTPTPTPTLTATATTISTITATPTQTPTPAPTTPVTAATASETAAADQTSSESDSTASLSATPKQTMECPSDEGISGFTSIFATIGLLIALYTISKRKR